MPPRRSNTTPSTFVILTLLPLVSAQISLQQVQPIIDFPSSCITAYSTNLPRCTKDMFHGVGGAQRCSQDCFNDLVALTPIIQIQCAGQQAGANTVIGHFFIGDADLWLCGYQTSTAGGGGAAPTAAGTTSVSQTVDASSTTTQNSASSSSTTTKSTSNSISTKTSTSTTLGTSTQTSSSSSSSSSTTAPVATAGGNAQPIGITGGGSPFDINVPAAGMSLRGSLSLTAVLGAVIAVVALAR